MSAVKRNFEVSLATPNVDSPTIKYNVGEIGELALRWFNSEYVRMPDPSFSHLLYKGTEATHRLFIPTSLRDELLDAKFPQSGYPNWDVYQVWRERKAAEANPVVTPEIKVVLGGVDRTLTHYNARIRRFMDVPEIDHLEVKVPMYGGYQLQGYDLYEDRTLATDLFNEEFPIYTLPCVDMDQVSLDWHLSRFEQAA